MTMPSTESSPVRQPRKLRTWTLKNHPIKRVDSAPIDYSRAGKKDELVNGSSKDKTNTLNSGNLIRKDNVKDNIKENNNKKDFNEDKNKTEDIPTCPFCFDTFPSYYNLNRHVMEYHNENSNNNERLNSNDSYDDSDEDNLVDFFSTQLKSTFKKVIPTISEQTSIKVRQLKSLTKGNHPDIAFGRNLERENSINSVSSLKDKEEPIESSIKTNHYKNLNAAKKCFEKKCQKNFGLLSIKLNCKRCGEVFCEEHCDFDMKLDSNALHDPNKGQWFKVCLSCYKSKESYKNSLIITRDLSLEFFSIRRKEVDKIQLETNRLSSRLEKLALIQLAPSSNGKTLGSNSIKLAEQAIVPWQPDNEVKDCPYCKRIFSKFTLRKHHCRVCGKVVCGDVKCSSKISINSLTFKRTKSLKKSAEIIACTECRTIVSKLQDSQLPTQQDMTVLRLYAPLKRHQATIQKHLPKFNALIYALKSKDGITENDNDVQSAFKVRKELLDAFAQLESSIQTIKRVQTNGNLQKRLLDAIAKEAILFLQANTISLSILPKLLNQAKSNRNMNNTPTKQDSIQFDTSSLSNFKESNNNNITLDSNSVLLYQQIEVFKEQSLMLKKYIDNAKKERRLDDVRQLSKNLLEVENEIQSLKSRLD